MKHRIFNTPDHTLHVAILIIRVSFGLFYVIHGWPKITGGTEFWAALGSNMELIGLGFAPAFWGFMAALAEFGGGLLLILGLFTRPVAFLMLFTMIIATMMHIQQGDPINTIMNPLKGLVVFAALLYSGAGKYAVDRYFTDSRKSGY